MFRVELTRQAERAFDGLMRSYPEAAKRVANALDRIAAEPHAGIPLKGELKGLWKYRVGSYRIIYRFEKSRLIVTVIDIGNRKDVYR